MNKKEALEIYEKRTPFSKGKRGLISFSEHKNKKHCIKEKNPASEANNRIFLEYENNKKLNEINVGPTIYFYDEEKDFLIRDFVEGENIFDLVDKNKHEKDFKKKLISLLLNIFDQCRRMDKIKMNKLEMTNPHKDIIIDNNNNPFIIDFERCKFVARPKNVTQFCQFLTKGNMKNILEEQKIFLDKEKIMKLAEEYKNTLSDENYELIKKEIEK